MVSASGGDLRLLRRRDLQRGSQRPPRRRRRGFRPGRRHERPAPCARVAAGSGARSRADPLRQAAAHLPGTDQRETVRVQRGYRARRRARAAGRRTRPAGGREEARRPRLRPGRAEGAGGAALPLPRVARGRGARPRGVRPGRELLAVHLCRAPRAALRARGVLRGRPRRRRAAGRARGQDPAARGAGPARTSAPRPCPSRPRPGPDRDPLRRPAARAGRR